VNCSGHDDGHEADSALPSALDARLVPRSGLIGCIDARRAAQLTSVLLYAEGGHIRANTATGRVRDRVLPALPRVSILRVVPRDARQRYIQVRDRVIEISEDGVLDHTSWPSLKYRQLQWRRAEGQTRASGRILQESMCTT
jgi:hypothetical protein